MRLRSGHSRAGFTLIELLVVITIIAVLVSLLMSAVMKVRDAGERAETTSRITAINNAIGTFKSNAQFGQMKYIPAGRPDGTNAPFRLRNSYTATTIPDMFSPEAQYIMQVFGTGTNLTNLGNPALPGNDTSQPIFLDANQTLTFFLCGFPEPDGQGNANFSGFANGQQPFAPRVAGTDVRKGPVLDLGGRRKYVLDPVNGFARMTDAWNIPFAYYCAYNGQPNKYYGYNADPTNPAQTAIYPVGLKPYSTGAGSALRYEQESGYQLISAGKDKQFGLSGSWDNVDQFGRDDQANFSPSLLGGGRK